MDPSRIKAARHELLGLHKALIDAARVELERIDGRLNANEMLDRLLNDERLAWLRPLSELIVAFDELLESETPIDPAPYVARAVALLTYDAAAEADPFATAYARLLHEVPDVTMAHAATMRALA
ncbi:MAG TPA: hypothetical protein VM261_14695 [Kofleriaceae bacterium]|nr:hypothetical protein [Kofleriaceae bacterium]